ncbi:unnamed protein product [Didymodactylos carnosus]|uniref:Uncharacterized protein n=1 Tax=Didymodactylos carnosus TaxID=1234261 RepID=A0A814HVG4_9BILA|nr:unnamed protein product [Didymodactylos carnosus]CAF1014469.1 unnamed protein product [Didymodactylos carnosus]CAF3766222.1 unnamed protein product [Didymodactylos carnosus]CAF3785928.1 unnamed protein product [Didymodactylos carnosus]
MGIRLVHLYNDNQHYDLQLKDEEQVWERRWCWKANINPLLAELNEEEWKEYSDIENGILEHAYQQNAKQAEIGNYRIDLEKHCYQWSVWQCCGSIDPDVCVMLDDCEPVVQFIKASTNNITLEEKSSMRLQLKIEVMFKHSLSLSKKDLMLSTTIRCCSNAFCSLMYNIDAPSLYLRQIQVVT